jgi:hypothetical protein
VGKRRTKICQILHDSKIQSIDLANLVTQIYVEDRTS